MIREDMALSSAEATKIQDLFLRELYVELLPTLRKQRDLKTVFNCRFFWDRVEDVYGTLCDELVPTVTRGAVQLLALAIVAGVGVVVQYKVWRHLKDNKVLKAEMERFEEALGKFEKQMHDIEEHKRRRDEQQRAYRQAVLEAQGSLEED